MVKIENALVIGGGIGGPVLGMWLRGLGVEVTIAEARPSVAEAEGAFLGVALAFSVWCLDVYMIDLSPHWGQRELVKRYYELRTGPEQPIVACRMSESASLGGRYTGPS